MSQSLHRVLAKHCCLPCFLIAVLLGHQTIRLENPLSGEQRYMRVGGSRAVSTHGCAAYSTAYWYESPWESPMQLHFNAPGLAHMDWSTGILRVQHAIEARTGNNDAQLSGDISSTFAPSLLKTAVSQGSANHLRRLVDCVRIYQSKCYYIDSVSGVSELYLGDPFTHDGSGTYLKEHY